MPHLYVSSAPQIGPDGETYGYVYEKDDGGNLNTEIEDDVAFDRRSQILKYRRSTYIIGTFSRPWVRDRFGAYHRGGLRAPLTKPTMVDGSFSSGSEGNMIGYQTFVMKTGDVKIAESNPGPQTDTLVSAGTGRLWDSLDWQPADPHATHARGYVSVDGALPALAWERPLSPVGTTVEENVGTAALGVTLPVRKGLDQRYALDIYARGVPPYTKYAEEYKDAFFYAGDPSFPDRIYYSKLFEPEAVNSTPITVRGRTDEPWLRTTDGSPVTGLKRQGDELIVGTFRGIDRIQGYTYGDYAIHRISNYWGVVSHFSMTRCGPQDSLFFLAPQGPTIYNAGSFHFIGDPIQSWWRDWFRRNPILAQDAFGVEDRFWETYNLLLPQSYNETFDTEPSLWLVVDFNTAERGRPVWVFDYRARKDWVSGELAVDADASYYERYTGSCDGTIRQENVEDDPDDDGDDYRKKLTVQTGHRYMGDQSGSEEKGFTFHPLDLFMKHETNEAVAQLWCGDDQAPPEASKDDGTSSQRAAEAHWERTLPATQLPTGQRPRVPPTSQRESVSEASGKGVTLNLEVTAPLDVEFRGWSIEFREGPASKQPFKV